MRIEGIHFGDNIHKIIVNDQYQLFQMENDTGKGQIRMYKVFENIYLLYSDYHMDYCESTVIKQADLLCFDHCREGRIEELTGERYKYLSEGDLRIDNREGNNTKFNFPFSHYHGVSIAFFLTGAQKSLTENFHGFPVDLKKLQNKFCSKQSNSVIRGINTIDQIFRDLYQMPCQDQDYYFRIKIYELLLFLDGLESDDRSNERPYFYKSNVEKVKEVHRKIVSNLDKRFTIEQLSKDYNISLTTLKKCFKGIYGSSIHAYTKKCRMHLAAKLLKTTNDTIAEIGLSIAYNSPSKFSAAFKDLMGSTPQIYRRLNKA